MPSRFWADRPLLHKGLFVVAIPLSVVVLLGTSFLGALREADATSAMVERSFLITDTIDDVLLDLVDAETGVRGYLLTGRVEFVEPYVRGSRSVPLDLAELRELVAATPVQAAAVQRLEPVVQERMAILKRILAMPPEERADVPTSVLLEGKTAMDEARDILGDMTQAEARQLATRRAADRRAHSRQLWIVGAGILIGFCGGAAAVVMFARTVVRRVRTIEAGAHRLEAGASIGEMPEGRDEVGELGRSIAHAAAILAARERSLAEHAAEVEDLYNHAPCGYHSLDASGTFVRVNDTELRWLGYERKDLVGRTRFRDLLTPEGADRFEALFPRLKQDGNVRDLEFDIVRADGTTLPVSVNATAMLDGAGTFRYTRSTVFDISERRRLEDTLREMATSDELTGLLNRRGFLNLAEPQLRIAERASYPALVLFGDVDGLKAVNDTFGHEAGSRLLTEVAGVLRDCVRDSDILGRLGGDEFCALLPLAEPEAERRVIDRIRETISRRNASTDEPFELSISIGTARFDPSSPVALEELLRRADEAMYVQKQRRVGSGDAARAAPAAPDPRVRRPG
jgi:diguanylate cyclase (GGDEF)-like protein/PAS domain S-box-containing protein